MDIDLAGGFKIKNLADADPRLTMLLWGPAGCGKSTYAASAPGKKLWINFDPDGTASLGSRDDILLLDLSNEKDTLVEKFKDDDPLRLSSVLANEDVGIDTVVVDSVTSYSQLAVGYGISQTKGATLARPSPGAYGARNAYTLRLVSGLLRLTGKYGKNIIFICHENSPTTDDNGNVLFITVMLGGQLPDQTALQISEVWFMNDDGKQRKIAVRPCRMRKPMKSRSIMTNGSPEFVLEYDPFGSDGCFDPDKLFGQHSLTEIYNLWLSNGRNKLPIPGSADYQKLKQKLLEN